MPMSDATPLLFSMNEFIVHFENASEAREIGAVVDGLSDRIEAETEAKLVVRDLMVKIEGTEHAVQKIGGFVEDLRKARHHTNLDDPDGPETKAHQT